jgi:hypothetical protein
MANNKNWMARIGMFGNDWQELPNALYNNQSWDHCP